MHIQAELISQSTDGHLKLYHCPQLIAPYILHRGDKYSASSNQPQSLQWTIENYNNGQEYRRQQPCT